MVDNRDTCRPRNIFQRNKMEVTSVRPHTRRLPMLRLFNAGPENIPSAPAQGGEKCPLKREHPYLAEAQ